MFDSPPPTTFRTDITASSIRIVLPMDLSSHRAVLMAGGLFVLLAALLAIGAALLAVVDVATAGWILLALFVSSGAFCGGLLLLASRIQPSLWWPALLRGRMPILLIAGRTLTVKDHRGEQVIALESIQGLRQDGDSVVVERQEGNWTLAWKLRLDERAYLVNVIGTHAKQVRDAMIEEGHRVDDEAVPPQALRAMIEREP